MEEFFDLIRPKPKTCTAVGTQTAKVCLPVSVAPYAITGPVLIQCCGKPYIDSGCKKCKGKENAVCDFTITQKIHVEIPVEFGATVDIGETYVDCECAKTELYGDTPEPDADDLDMGGDLDMETDIE